MSVAVVITAYNCGDFIAAAIESALGQGANVVVVDDGSPDDAALKASMYPVTVLTGRKGGACSARNAGAAVAPPSDYILFLDGDDVLGPGMLCTLENYLDGHPDVGAAYCGSIAIGPDGAPLLDQRSSRVTRWRPTRWWVEAIPESQRLVPFESFFVHQSGMIASTTLVRRSVWGKLDGWDEDMQLPLEDNDMALQLSLVADVHYLSARLLMKRDWSQQHSRSAVGFRRNARKLATKWGDYGAGTTAVDRVRLSQQFRSRYQLAYRVRELRAAIAECNPKWAGLTILHLVRNLARYRPTLRP